MNPPSSGSGPVLHPALPPLILLLLLLLPHPPRHTQWPLYEDGDPFVAPPRPIATCREAVAHPACFSQPADSRAFVCPACSAAAEGRPFTYAYASLCGTPLDEHAARVLVVGARLALVLLQRSAGVARAEAERLARDAAALRGRAYLALGVAQDVDTKMPSWNINARKVGEGSGTGTDVPLVQEQRCPMWVKEAAGRA
jgi:hypothetical protein